MKFISSLILSFTIALTLSAEEIPDQLYKLKAGEAKTLLGMGGATDMIPYVLFDIEAYKISYKTTFKGKEIKASGVIILPKDMKSNAPILMYHHPTISSTKGAPSKQTAPSGLELPAFNGYILFIPDYIGYGDSEDMLHPYYVKEAAQMACVDMLKEGIKWLKKHEISFRKDLFLAGFSEGGYVNLVVTKAIDEDPSIGVKIKGSVPAGGITDLVEMTKHVITPGDTIVDRADLNLFIASYKTYMLDRSYNEIYKGNYAKMMDTLYTCGLSRKQINELLPLSATEIFNEKFYKNYKTAKKDKEFINALKVNSLLEEGWKPAFPIKFIVGEKDEVVNPINADLMIEQLKKNGVEEKYLSKDIVKGAGHVETGLASLTLTLDFFNELDADNKEQAKVDYVKEHGPLPNRKYGVIASDAKAALAMAGYTDFLPYIEHDVSVHHFTYRTKFKRGDIEVSGLITVPVGVEGPLPILINCHGTILDNKGAPSTFKSPTGLEVFSSKGFITFFPDYIGFGDSYTKVIHTYMDRDYLAKTCVDMLVEGKKLLDENGIKTSGDVYITGYSEGAFAALATQRYLEMHPELGFEVKANALVSCPCFLEDQSVSMMSKDTLPNAAYLALMIYYYNDQYIKKQLNTIFKSPYDTLVTTIFTSGKSTLDIMKEFPILRKELLIDDFTERFNQNDVVKSFLRSRELFADNWVPKGKIKFLHGDSDILVPIENSIKAKDLMIERGKDPKDISFSILKGANHPASGIVSIPEVLEFIIGFVD